METVSADDRVDVLLHAIRLLHGGDASGEDLAREVAPHLCWDGAVDIVSDLPDADPMEPGEPLRVELDQAFLLHDVLAMDSLGMAEYLQQTEGLAHVQWHNVEDAQDRAYIELHHIAGRILALSDAEYRRTMVAEHGLIGNYAPPLRVVR